MYACATAQSYLSKGSALFQLARTRAVELQTRKRSFSMHAFVNLFVIYLHRTVVHTPDKFAGPRMWRDTYPTQGHAARTHCNTL